MPETLEQRVARLERENAHLRRVAQSAERALAERNPTTRAFRLEDLRRNLRGGFRSTEGLA